MLPWVLPRGAPSNPTALSRFVGQVVRFLLAGAYARGPPGIGHGRAEAARGQRSRADDPRDPANISVTPAWVIELRNGLRAISEQLERGDDRESRLAFRVMRPHIEEDLSELTPAERARSVTWILDADGTFGHARRTRRGTRDRHIRRTQTRPAQGPNHRW